MKKMSEKKIIEEKPTLVVSDKLSTTPVVESVPLEDSSSIVADATKAAERLEAANKITTELLTRQEQLQIARTLGGSSSAGVPTLTKDQKADIEAKKMLAGTGYDELLFPKKD